MAIARMAGQAGVIGTNILVAHLLTVEAAGQIQKTLLPVQMAILIGAFGIQTSVYYFMPRIEPNQRRALMVQSFAALGLIGTLIAADMALKAGSVAAWMAEPPPVDLIQMGALCVLFGVPALLADPVFITADRARLAAANSVVGALIQIGLAALILALGLPLTLVLLAMATATAVRLVWALGFAWITLSTENGPRWDRALLGAQLAYILPVGLTAMADTFSSWLDRLLVSAFYGSREFALYSYGAIEIPFISLIIGSLTPVLLPHFSAQLASGNHPGVLKVWHRATTKASIILFGLFFLFLWVAPEFLAVLYSSKYTESSTFFRIYLALLPVRIVAFMPLLFALGRGSTVLGGALAEIVLNTGLSLFLMRMTPLGMAGAAVGTVLSTFCQAAFYLSRIRQSLGTTWAEVLPWKSLAWDLGKCALFFLPLGLLKVVAAPPLASLVAAGLLFVIFSWYRVLPRLKAA
ncbi:MAG: oligosaccharide flippase family protein [Candidatus Sumerlaeaceae bacterium]|nr:oligosaccharide flippase family protein [Candidatus Sumerlaeaceae bacterium]